VAQATETHAGEVGFEQVRTDVIKVCSAKMLFNAIDRSI